MPCSCGRDAVVCAGEMRGIEGTGAEAHGELQETRWVDMFGVVCSACKTHVNVRHHVPAAQLRARLCVCTVTICMTNAPVVHAKKCTAAIPSTPLGKFDATDSLHHICHSPCKLKSGNATWTW